jgi:hypothetical protein
VGVSTKSSDGDAIKDLVLKKEWQGIRSPAASMTIIFREGMEKT